MESVPSGESSLLAEIERDVLSDRPLADALRKCVVLGGKAGSVPLREWATRELRGYNNGEELPGYRMVPAALRLDAVLGNNMITGQQISRRELPEFAQEKIGELFPCQMGIGEVEAAIKDAGNNEGSLRFSLPMSMELAHFMDQASQNPFQHITALYWSVSSVNLHSIVDQVRTTLAELVAELRAGMPRNQQVPSEGVARQAVEVAVHGAKSRVTVTTAQATGGSDAAVVPEASGGDSPFWTLGRKIGACLVGLASIAAAVVAVIEAWN